MNDRVREEMDRLRQPHMHLTFYESGDIVHFSVLTLNDESVHDVSIDPIVANGYTATFDPLPWVGERGQMLQCTLTTADSVEACPPTHLRRLFMGQRLRIILRCTLQHRRYPLPFIVEMHEGWETVRVTPDTTRPIEGSVGLPASQSQQ